MGEALVGGLWSKATPRKKKKNATLTESIKHLRVWLKQPRSMKPWVQNPQPPPKKKKRWKYLILSFNMIKQALIFTILITHQSKQKLTKKPDRNAERNRLILYTPVSK
jgi:hypothetical protein